MPLWLQRGGAGAIFVLAIASSVLVWRGALARGPDRVAVLDAEFQVLARSAPGGAAIGYLVSEPDSPDHVLEYYVAQYVFAPRLVLRRTDLDYLVVAPGAVGPDVDARLADFEPIARSQDGHRLYQRRAK